MLDILEWALDVMGFTYCRLDGRYFFVHYLNPNVFFSKFFLL